MGDNVLQWFPKSGLANALRANAMYPLHIPGHKRNPKFTLTPELCQDITEIEGFDDLHSASGLIKETQDLAAKLYGARKSFLLVNGSSCGNLSAIRALHRPFGGTELIVIGESHRSVLHAAELCNLNTVTYDNARDAKICVVTSPAYNGETLDIPAIAARCHAGGIALHVDAAHGAHLGFNPYFPENATRQGADTAVESLHKTLPALGQTSLLHVCGVNIDAEEISRQLDVFETSSPSYVLMASADYCLRLLDAKGTELFDGFAERLRRFYKSVENVPFVRRYSENSDPAKIALYGESIPELLRENLIEPERVTPDGTILITTICDEDFIFDKLTRLLIKENLK
ncbi:MAG: hypothetical protein LBN43_05680 [Oscillospiraceae bacterium]|jgi:arginine/lysine/ornithine decarboxylase|nr:hypothetical protein [Oscillospiraceae bacterium]